MANDIGLVTRVTLELKRGGIEVLVGGGWAEELLGVIPPRPHKDVDLFYIGDNFDQIERYIRDNNLKKVKHKLHKRAYLLDGVMIEVIIIQKDEKGVYTKYSEDKILRWPQPLGTVLKSGIVCLSAEALLYRRIKDSWLKEK